MYPCSLNKCLKEKWKENKPTAPKTDILKKPKNGHLKRVVSWQQLYMRPLEHGAD